MWNVDLTKCRLVAVRYWVSRSGRPGVGRATRHVRSRSCIEAPLPLLRIGRPSQDSVHVSRHRRGELTPRWDCVPFPIFHENARGLPRRQGRHGSTRSHACKHSMRSAHACGLSSGRLTLLGWRRAKGAAGQKSPSTFPAAACPSKRSGSSTWRRKSGSSWRMQNNSQRRERSPRCHAPKPRDAVPPVRWPGGNTR